MAGQAAHFGGGSMVAMCATAERSAVLEADGEKNVYGGVYHVREPESQVLPMRFGEAAECVVAWQERRMFVRVRSPGLVLVSTACTGRCSCSTCRTHCPELHLGVLHTLVCLHCRHHNTCSRKPAFSGKESVKRVRLHAVSGGGHDRAGAGAWWRSWSSSTAEPGRP
jgi:hypothetical protein